MVTTVADPSNGIVTLKITETVLNREPVVSEYQGPGKRAAISKMMAYAHVGRIGDLAALVSLLLLHDDLRLGGPTWDTRFEFSFSVG